MSSYGRSKKAATKKRKRLSQKSKSVEAKKPRTRPKIAAKARPKAQKRPVGTKRTSKKASPAKRPKVKAKASAKAKAKPKTKPKKLTAAQKRGHALRSRRAKELRAMEARLKRLEAERQKLRRMLGKKPTRKKVAAKKRQAERIRKRVAPKVAPPARPSTPGKGTSAHQRVRDISTFQRLKGRFNELLELAKKKRQTPQVNKRVRTIDSERSTGKQRVVTIDELVEPGTVEDIMYRIRKEAGKMSGKFPYWMIVMAFSAMGERLVGYDNRVLKASDPDAMHFQTNGIDSTGLFHSRNGALDAAETILEDLADEKNTMVWLHHARIMNFSRRNEP